MHANAQATLKLLDTAVVMVALGGVGHNVQFVPTKKKPVLHVNAHATPKLLDTAVVMVALGGVGHNVQSAVTK